MGAFFKVRERLRELLLAAGEETAFVTDHRLIRVRLCHDEVVRKSSPGGFVHFRFRRVQFSELDVREDRIVKEKCFLRNEADLFAQRTLCDSEPTVKDAPDAIELPQSKGNVEFDKVTFRYAGGVTDAIKDLNLRIEAGKTYALVGASGAGKSTILSLILRLYDPYPGPFESMDVTCGVSHNARCANRSV